MSTWNQWGLMDAASPIIEEFVYLHDFILVILTFILTLVGGIIFILFFNRFINSRLLEEQYLEFIWTIIPAFLLVHIALPSLLLLYILEDTSHCTLTVKVIGHQWYWSYEYSDFWGETKSRFDFESYMVPSKDTYVGEPRLLETDNNPVVPYLVTSRIIVRRADVLHSWAIPSLGVKVDANPGRLNQVKVISYVPGRLYGQCSEICGANHRFIPITLEVTDPATFLAWMTLNSS